MFARIAPRLTFANVASSLALFLSLTTGVAYAANEWTGANIVDGSLTNVDLAQNTIGSGRIKDEALEAVDLAPGSVTTSELADGGITAADLAANSVGASAIVTDAVHALEIADNSIDSGEIVNNTVTLSDMKGANVNGTISFTAGTVPNGRCEHFDITVAGAARHEVVVISARSTPPEGMIIYGVRVPSAGHVTMALCNFTGGTSPAISNLLIHVATFG